MTSRKRFEAWYADQIWANGETWKDACRLAWKARDAEVERLVEALREACDLLDAEEPRCKTTDECYQCTKMAEFDALLREYDGEKRDE